MIKNTTLFFSFFIFLSVWANESPRYSLDQMHDRSSFIADGQIIDSRVIEIDKFDHPDGNLFVNRKYESHFKVQKIIKADLPTDQNVSSGQILILNYWHTEDARYRGDMGPLLQEGHQFRLFSSVLSEQDGKLVAQIVSGNNVRPEAYEFKKLDEESAMEVPPFSEVVEIAEENEQPKLATKEPAVVATAESSTEAAEKSSQWWLWLIGAVVVISGLGLVLRRKS